MVTTRKTNADAHPGRVVLDSQQTRRTKEQIKNDNTRVKATAQAKKEKAAEEYRAVVERISQLEDAVALAEKDSRTHAHRPDLRYGSHDAPESREGGDDRFALGEGNAQSGMDASTGPGDFAGADDEGPGPAREGGSDEDSSPAREGSDEDSGPACEGGSDEDARQIPLSDDDQDIPPKKRKEEVCLQV